MVGEIRDGETARISIEAALTGHMVLSTLHTNDAPSALTRLNEMGVEPFITGAAVSAVLAQRLARRLCPHCAEPYEPKWDELMALHLDEKRAKKFEGATFYRKHGCPRCGDTGYKGRVGVFQFLEMTPRLEQLASEKSPRDVIAEAARAEGMRTMWEDGIDKVAGGLTSAEELARVCSA
jgi:type IV pilus assembly protein PilB